MDIVIPSPLKYFIIAHQISLNQVNVKATTNEGMGFVGSEDGVACYATVLIEKI